MRTQRGFALMFAIFLIVTLATVGVYLLTIATGQIEAATQDEQGARAYQSARTGVDWGAYQLLRNTPGAFATSCLAGTTTTNTLTLAPGLAGFCATVRCEQTGSETEGAVTLRTYQLTVTGFNIVPASATCATSTVGPTYVERQLELNLSCTGPAGTCGG